MKATTKKAPGAAVTAAEGVTGTINEEGTKSVMNTVAPTTTTRYLELFAGEPTIDEVAWAEVNLASMPTVVLFDETRKVKTWQGDDGRWYRTGGLIVASPHSRGRFRITLYKGADVGDLALLERAVQQAKQGRFTRFGWCPFVGKDGDTLYSFRWSFVTDPAKGRVNRFGDPLLRLRPCRVDACVETYHDGKRDEWVHTLEPIRTPNYTITVERGETEDQWRVEVYADDCRLLPSQVGGMISDMEWATAECRKLNTAHQSVGAPKLVEAAA